MALNDAYSRRLPYLRAAKHVAGPRRALCAGAVRFPRSGGPRAPCDIWHFHTINQLRRRARGDLSPPAA